MALSFYNSFAEDLVDATWDWVADTINIMLMTNAGYTFSNAHNFRDDITGEVTPTGTGYTSGGLALDGKTASTANPCVLSANDEVIAQNAGGFTSARKYAIVKITGGAASTDPLMAYGTAGADFGNVAGALTLDVPASWITITV